jgi:Holliday junction resolvase RusA-like endonuclease
MKTGDVYLGIDAGKTGAIVMNEINFSIPLPPTAQMRPRFATRNNFSVAYKDKKQLQHENNILFFLKQYAPKTPFKSAVSLSVICYMPRPKSHYRTGSNANKLKAIFPDKHTVKPDVDNLLKMLCDCMNGIFFYDDRQICDVTIKKIYISEGESPRWEVKVIYDI